MIYNYLNKLFEEFKKVYGINDTFENFSRYEDFFTEWIFFRRNAAKSYIQLFDHMTNYDEVQVHTIAEFGKGVLDTVAIEMAKHTNYQSIVISPYAQTIKEDSGIEVFTGDLTLLNDGNVIVSYPSMDDYFKNPNCYSDLNDNIGTLMTQLPYSEKKLLPFLRLIDSNKTLFIGTFGALSDKDCEENLNVILNLYKQLSDRSYIDVKFCSETLDNSYLSAIKIKSNNSKKLYKYYFPDIEIDSRESKTLDNYLKYEILDNSSSVDKRKDSEEKTLKLYLGSSK